MLDFTHSFFNTGWWPLTLFIIYLFLFHSGMESVLKRKTKNNEEFEARLKDILNSKELKETHTRGHLSVEANFTSLSDCDFGIQIAEDGRVWICINGQAFIRFKPKQK